MKKSRIFSALLVLALLSTCVIGGTFAKYVTSAEGTSDSARVAKWGVTITGSGSTFATSYATDEGVYSGTIATSVLSSNTDKLVAPGTHGEMAKSSISGTPEVAVKVTFEATTFSLSDWTDGTNFYCPLVFKISGNSYLETIDGSTYSDASSLETAVKNAINGYTQVYGPGALVAGDTNSVKVEWEWPFSTSDANDVKDTYLGNQAVTGTPATVTLEVKTTVTQID